MVHAAGDPGFIAWTNSVDSQLASVAGVSQPRAVWDDFTSKGNGALSTADSGQTYSNYPSGTGPSAMQIISGKLTAPGTSSVAGYAQVDIHAPVTHFGGRVTFTSFTTDNGSVAFPIFKTINTLSGVPDSDCHLAVNPSGWVVGRFLSGVFTQIANVVFPSALTADGSTVYDIDASLRAHTLTVVVRDPAGGDVDRTSITDSRLAATGTVACVETFRPASTDTQAAVVAWYADATPQVPSQPPLGRKVAYWQPSSLNEIAIPSSETAIDTTNLRTTFRFGASGGAIVDLSGVVKAGAATDIYWGIRNGTTGYGTALAVSAPGPIGPTECRARLIIPAGTFTPLSFVQFDWSHFCTVTNASTLFSAQSGLGRNAVMTIEPLP